MSAIHRTVAINASVEKVFEFLDNPENLSRCTPSVVRVMDVIRSGRGVGDTFRVIYKTLGMTFDEKVTVTGVHLPPKTTPHRRYQIRRAFEGGMTGRLTWTLEAQDTETDVSVDFEYELMGGVVGKALDALLLRQANEKNTRDMLEKMKVALATERASSRPN
jgi:carbon monoxide dehydrogenase subunit G